VDFCRRGPDGLAAYRRSAAVTIRWATPADTDALLALAELDDAAVPPAPVLLAFVGDELWAALSLRTEALISDPFRPSAGVAALVRDRARHLTVPETGQPRRRLRRLLLPRDRLSPS
jgi:hypothetical protein